MTKDQEKTQNDSQLKWRPNKTGSNFNVKSSSLRPNRSFDRVRSLRPQRNPLKGLIKSQQNDSETANDQ